MVVVSFYRRFCFIFLPLFGALSFVFSIFSSKTGFITLRCRSFLMQELLKKSTVI